MTKKENRLEKIILFLTNNGFAQNAAGNYKAKSCYGNKNIIVNTKGNNIKIKYGTELIYNELISKTSTAKLEVLLKPISFYMYINGVKS